MICNYLLLPSLLISITHSLPSPGDGFRRSDLFLDEPYFLGIPNIAVDTFGQDDDSGSGLTSDQLSLQSKLKVGKAKNKGKANSSSNWPGRRIKIKLENTGTDVVKAFQKNMEAQRKKTESFGAESVINALEDEINTCEKTCRSLDVLSEKWVCILNCVTENKGRLSEVTDVLYYGIKTLCHTVNTFYGNFGKFRVKSLKTFQTIMDKMEAPLPVSSNVPLRTMFAQVIKNVFSAMAPFRPMLNKFERDLGVLQNTLNLKANILVGANPGCSMVNMKKQIQNVLGVILKDPSLSDYIMLQGYALFTALTKYVDEFPTKKEFSVLHQGLDMMLGTNCGLFVYGATGETTDCDQFGGYPVLNMPVPEFMWPDDLHATCQETKEKMLLAKQKENARRKREAAAAEALLQSESDSVATEEAETLKRTVRRRRSLVVGEK